MRLRRRCGACGIGRGDRVVALMANCPEAVIALIACASVGAVWSVCSPEYGLSGIVSRFEQLEPKLLIAVDGHRWNGRDHDRREQVTALLGELPTVEHLLWVPQTRCRHAAPERAPGDHMVRSHRRQRAADL